MALLQIENGDREDQLEGGVLCHQQSICDQIDLTLHTPTTQPNVHLSFFEHAHNLKAFNRGISCFHGLEAKRWLDQTLKLAVIAFESVV